MSLQSLLQIFSPAPHLPEIADQEQIKSDYKYWRQRIFYSMLIGYAFYYLTRRSFTFVMPGLIADLGFDKSQLGLLGSILSISYGMSKFISGVMADQSNPRYFMAIGLFLTGLCNLFFGLSSSLWVFMLFWGANGLFQGFGWPACTRCLTNWYSQSERGSWWSSVSVAHNLGAFITPWIVGLCLKYLGWRAGMYLPGVVCLAGSLFLINRLRDAPQSLGLPTIEKFRNDYQGKQKEESGLSTRELLKVVLSNPYVWMLSFAYFFLYVLRMGLSDWTALYLYEVKGYGALGSSGTSSLFEAGGFFGCLTAGWSSDRLFGGRRAPVCTLFAVGIIGAIAFFWLVPDIVILQWAAIFLLGFTIFGPQLLIGMFASELCPKYAAATANGFVGWIAYIGAAVAGFPMGVVIDKYGWGGAFAVLFGCSLLCLLLLLPLRGVTRATVEGRKGAFA
ncbi:MAG: MFS transporter [Parachlamydia sp.]|nr:MFS transporter [Parachlamydia sp.]